MLSYNKFICFFSLTLAWFTLWLPGVALSMGMGGDPGCGSTPSLLNITYLSSIPTQNRDPIRIATDKNGLLYVTAPTKGKILIFSPEGGLVNSLEGFKKPLSVAVDKANRIYVGDAQEGRVTVLSPEGATLFSLGQGPGEFGLPGDMAVAENGLVYVTDSVNNVVKVYAADGAFLRSFGGYGVNEGQMIFPTGIACDDINEEIYVADNNNGRLEVFDLAGNFKRVLAGFGTCAGKLTRPQGIYIANSKVYVADAFQSTVEAFDRNGNFLAFIGQYGRDPGKLKIPMDVAGNGAKLFIANTDNERIETFEVHDPQGLTVTPAALSFNTVFNINPSGQTVQITPEVNGAAVSWTATTSSAFIVPTQSSGTSPAAITVNIDAGGLAVGAYTGKIIFHSPPASDYPLTVNLEVAQPQFLISPSALNLLYQQEGPLVNESLSINMAEEAVSWSAASDVPWLTLSSFAGTTPSNIIVSLTPSAQTLAPGQYSGTITLNPVNMPGGGPVKITVALEVINAGSIIINTNREEASFTLKGPATYTGTGKRWRIDTAKVGTYSLEFGYIKGFRKPVSCNLEVKTGGVVTVNGAYAAIKIPNVITAVENLGFGNEALVRVMDLQGNILHEFKAFNAGQDVRGAVMGGYSAGVNRAATNPGGAAVAMGDLNGDGQDEILIAPGTGNNKPPQIKIFHADGSLLSAFSLDQRTYGGANEAMGDIYGDGRPVIALCTLNKKKKIYEVIIYSVGNGYLLTEKGRFSLNTRGKSYLINPLPYLAFGDVNGDGKLELIVTSNGAIYIYAFDQNLSPSLVKTGSPLKGKDYDGKSSLTVTTGDIDGDGQDEIILGYEDTGKNTVVRAIKSDMADYGFSIKAFIPGQLAPALAFTDEDGVHPKEIMAGQQDFSTQKTLLRFFDFNGQLQKEITAFENSKYGVTATFGVIP